MAFEISHTFPAPLLEDVAQFIEYSETNRVEINDTGKIAGTHLIKLNERMSRAEPSVTARTQERFYPVIYCIKTLLVQGKLMYVETQQRGKSLLKPLPLLKEFKNLTPTEQYFYLVEVLMVECDWNQISDEIDGRRHPMNMLTLCASQYPTTVKAGNKLSIHSSNRFLASWAFEGFLQFGEFFGWWDIQRLSQEDRNYLGIQRRFYGETLTFTDFGEALLPIITLKRNYHRWNLPYRILQLQELQPVPGSALPASARKNVWYQLDFGAGSSDWEKVIFNAPYKKGEKYLEAFTHLFAQGELKHTLNASQEMQPHIGAYIFRVFWGKKVWRTIAMSHTHTLYDLHNAIQKAFKFEDDHLYAFFMDGKPWSNKAYGSPYSSEYPSVEKAVIGKLGLHERQKFLYIFDFGDEWRFDIIFEGALENIAIPRHPSIIDSAGKAPDQYGYGDDIDEEEDNIPPPPPKSAKKDKQSLFGGILGNKNSTLKQFKAEAEKAGLQVIGYQISFEPLSESESGEKPLPKEYTTLIDTLHKDFCTGAKVAATGKYEQVIQEAINKYPDVPILRNYQRNMYLFMKNSKKVESLDAEIYAAFPDYLFARLLYGRKFLHTDPERAFQILGGYGDISLVYPDRKIFHFTEVLNFSGFMAEYLAVKGDFVAAWRYIGIMEGLGVDHPVIEATVEEVNRLEVKFSLETLIRQTKQKSVRKKNTARKKKTK